MITKTIPNEITSYPNSIFFTVIILLKQKKKLFPKSTSMALGDYIQVAKDNKRRIKMRKNINQ